MLKLSPAKTTKFSLTSSLVAFLARVYDEQVFSQQFSLTSFNCWCVQLNKFSLTSFICSCVRHKWTSFSLTRSLVQKLAWPAFEQGSLSGKNLSIYVVHAHEQIKLVKENLVVWAELSTQRSPLTKPGATARHHCCHIVFNRLLHNSLCFWLV